MNTVKMAFFDAKPYERTFFDAVKDEHHVAIKYLTPRLNEDTVQLACGGYDAICAFINDTLSRPVIDALYDAGVKLIALRSAGYNNVDLNAAYKRIHVVRVPAYSPNAVAEHTLALIMSLNRKIHKAYFRTRENNFTINGLMGFDMRGKTAGIVGTGKIGAIMIEILRGLGMEVLAFDPFPKDDVAKEGGFEYVGLDELFARSDIISLHCPLTPDNAHMLNKDSFAKMKDDVMIVNTGRGGLIDTPDLLEALKKGKVGAAALDVYEEETEYFFEDFSAEIIRDDVLARLLSFPNVLITSHQAFFTREAMINIAGTTMDNVRLFFEKDELPNEICYRCSERPCRKKMEGRCFK